eukprot:10891770-Lingulodinium_polyedra.AAC.1
MDSIGTLCCAWRALARNSGLESRGACPRSALGRASARACLPAYACSRPSAAALQATFRSL